MVAPYERAFHGWFGPEGVPSSRTGARGLLVRSSLLLQSAHRLVPMRHDMVGDGRWGDAARFQAKPTQWFDHELMCSAALPARGAIPAMNFRTMRHRGSMPDKRAFVRDARHGFLHFRKKPFVAKVARCDLSTVQVLERACLRHFWGRPESFLIGVGAAGHPKDSTP